jgi:DNA-directed RNA polymerase subunit RPC12/RpoP
MIAFDCPGCGKRFQVKEEFGGRKSKCPTCGTRLLVPDAAAPVAAPRPVATGIPKFCSNCCAPWQRDAQFCRDCGASLNGQPQD